MTYDALLKALYENVDSLWPFPAIREALTQHVQRDIPMDDLLQDIDIISRVGLN